MKDYQEVKKILTEMLEDLDLRLAKITEDIKHTDQPLEKDFAELVTQNENNEVLDQLGNTARTEKELIKQAIARINRGEYGICKVCGEPIKEERLKVLPYSSLCIKCASKADN
ncbi:MAG: TraR/DksA family transcriptional regulator [Methylovulum sp.]